jgi:hypothetical protein
MGMFAQVCSLLVRSLPVAGPKTLVRLSPSQFRFSSYTKATSFSECIYIVSVIMVRTHTSMARSKYPTGDNGFETPLN